MDSTAQTKSGPRLLLASVVVLALLVWSLAGSGLPPFIIPPGRSIPAWPMLITAFLASIALLSLFPVMLRGSAKERFVSLLLGLFPLLALVLVTLWAISLVQSARP
jgi:hypothetical protein